MFTLHTLSDRYLIDISNPSYGGYGYGNNQQLVINRDSSLKSPSSSPVPIDINLLPRSPVPTTAWSQPIHGIIGVLSLFQNAYLLVIQSSTPVATILNTTIRMMTSWKVIPIYPTSPSSTSSSSPIPTSTSKGDNIEDDSHYLGLIDRFLWMSKFYFSYETDVTSGIQKLALRSLHQSSNQNQNGIGDTLTTTRNNEVSIVSSSESLTSSSSSSSSGSRPFWEVADERFFWNRALSLPLIRIHADPFIIPLMNGYIFQRQFRAGNCQAQFTLISRRSCQRAGRRYTARGVDINGHAANFADNEQILCIWPDQNDKYSVTLASFLQTRGSIPVIWEQPVSLKYSPKIIIHADPQSTALAFKRHFDTQTKLYGRNVCLNLVNQHGTENALTAAYTYQVNTNTDGTSVKLINWDFHHECKNMRFDNVNKLVKELQAERDRQGWFAAKVRFSTGKQREVEWEIIKKQNGVFRTNCVDCLDRTNVVQSAFAFHTLQDQLCAFVPGYSPTPPSQELDHLFKNCWADNADFMSIPYSGTGALKTDFTRTGKRTQRGALQDGVNSLKRYYLNNFQDGHTQDAIDLFVGGLEGGMAEFNVTPEGPSTKWEPQRSVAVFFARFTLALFLLLSLLTYLLPESFSPHLQLSIFTNLFLFLALVLIVGSFLLLRYGKFFVNKPMLRKRLSQKRQ